MTTVMNDEKRAKEAEFVDFFENAPIALHWLSDTGHVLWANKTEMSVLGYTPEEYIGANIMNFCPDETELVLEIFKALGTGNTIKDVPVRFRTKDGRIVHLLIDSNVNYKADGSFNHTRCFIRDDTGRKIKEARYKVAQEEAQRSIEQMDRFMCKAFHNIRTPCHIVTQLLGSLADALETSEKSEESSELLAMSIRSATGLMNVLDDAADAATFERGQTIHLKTERLDLAALAKSVIDSLEHIQYAVRPDVKVEADLKGDGPASIVGDYKVIHRILFHLVENAVKATNKGEIRLSIDSRPEGCHFAVSDTGCGIPGGAAAIHSVFQRYWQSPAAPSGGTAANNKSAERAAIADIKAGGGVQSIRDALDHSLSVSSGCEGLGLGLNVSFNLVQCMGSALAVSSGPGGTTFSFELPKPDSAEDLPAAADCLGDAVYVGLDSWSLDWQEQEEEDEEDFWEKRRTMLLEQALKKESGGSESGGSESEANSRDSGYNSSSNSKSEASPALRSTEPISSATMVAEGAFEADKAVHILLVEDNIVAQKVASKQLRKMGCTVDIAEDGSVAVEKLKANSLQGFYDLIFMDLRMPVMDGFAATIAIRKELKLTTTVLALSGETGQIGGKDVELYCEEIGFNGFLHKPCKPDQLRKALVEHLTPCAAARLTDAFT